MSKQHIFISYSRKDTDFVNRLAASLTAAGIPVWLDKTDLTPGTPNWEQAIRTAIDDSAAMVLVASPDSRASVYVHGELTLAKIQQRPVYPVWAAGDDWIDCIPLDMVNYQYVDCRGESYAPGVKNMTETLKKIRDVVDTITVSLPTHETIQLNLSQFSHFRDMLNVLYLKYLQDWYEPFTYGQEWILANVATRELLVTWEWLMQDYRWGSSLKNESLRFSMMEYPEFERLKPGSLLAVWEASRVRAAGIALHDAALKEKLLAPFGIRDLWLLHDDGHLKRAQPEDVYPQEYPVSFVMALSGTKLERVAFVQA